MTTFTGSITRLTTSKPVYALGEYPELLVDFYIQAHDLSWFETEWHAYLLTLDPNNNQIAQAFRSDFTPPFSRTGPILTSGWSRMSSSLSSFPYHRRA